ncbi:glycoside hydrolase family 13 protein [Favolaschia claudopus]|uniref:Glycoside hydrolase family 13 protein n=1 Tax=Favolaschia claudopus TaxID=2862362 RepID=A0AAW0C381_9AGAR
MFSAFKAWLSSPPALPRMRLGPEGNTDNPLMLQFFTWDTLNSELSWWKHLESEIPRLANMGFTQVWLPPPNKGAQPEGRGYDAYDLTRWGTREEFLSACKVAASHGVDIIIDAVLNHKLGADRVEKFPAVPVNAENRLKDEGPPREIDGTGLDWDHRTRSKAIYRIAGPGRKGWSRNVANELGNYDYLLGIDIDHRHPEVRKDLLNWVGFRLDAIKHIDRNFIYTFLTHVRRHSRKPQMFSVSEYWSADVKLILPYINAFRGETAFFDVPLHNNFHLASKQRAQYDLRNILNGSVVKERPHDAVTFVDNHESVIGQSLESWVDTNFKLQAYSLILLRQNGHPCVFYGDLYPNEECYDTEISRNLTLLVEARKKFAYGPCKDYFVNPDCIGFVRMGDSLHPGCAVLLSNKDDSTGEFTHTVRMFVGREHAGTKFRSFMSTLEDIVIDSQGFGKFKCDANCVEVWVRS